MKIGRLFPLPFLLILLSLDICQVNGQEARDGDLSPNQPRLRHGGKAFKNGRNRSNEIRNETPEGVDLSNMIAQDYYRENPEVLEGGRGEPLGMIPVHNMKGEGGSAPKVISTNGSGSSTGYRFSGFHRERKNSITSQDRSQDRSQDNSWLPHDAQFFKIRSAPEIVLLDDSTLERVHPQRFGIKCSMKYSLYQGKDSTNIQEPTQRELLQLVRQTTAFFSDTIREDTVLGPDFVDFDMNIESGKYNESVLFQYEMIFSTEILFEGKSLATEDEVRTILLGADYSSYITDYVRDDPRNTMYYTVKIQFGVEKKPN